MKKNIIKITLIAALGLMGSCSDDFLDVDPRELTEDTDSEYDPEYYVNSTYGSYTEWDFAFSWLGVTEMISDNADKGSSPSDGGGDKNLLDALQHTSTTGSVEAMWTRFFATIGRANYALQYIESYDEQYNLDDVYKNRLIGEAKFLRALSYFYLVRMFGDVPLQDINDPGTWGVRVAKSEIYAYIEADLQDAISKLPNKNDYPAEDLGRATKGAAQGLLAKVFLYEEKWQDAYDMAGTVMSTGGYGLEADYATVWRESTENGIESLFEIQARGEVIAHGVQQYSQTQGARGTSGWGWGFNTPSQNLLDAFNAEGDNIRRDATIIFRGETLWDGREVSIEVENPMYNEKAYTSLNSGDAETDKNIRVIRYAEILLIRAEAATYVGGDAAGPLNQVRARVNLTPIGNPTVQDVWKERRLELAFEHDRWFDIVRTGQGQAAMAADGKTFVVGKHELFPIPNAQLIQTPQMTQNPGW